jgi:hypothetical protein
MSRLTGKEVYSLMEAYQQVYAPQELTEEQVWEEVESWVNSLLEEGYDLSDYTWEEMYEQYLSEAGFFQGVGAGIDRAGSVVSGASRRASDAVGGAVSGAVGNAQRAGNSLASFAKKDIQKRVSDTIKTGQTISGGAQRAAGAVSGAVGNAQRAVGGAINREVGNAQRAVGGAIGGAQRAVGGAVGGAQRAVGGAVGGAQRAVGGAINAAGSKIGKEIEISRKVGAGEPPTASAKVLSPTPKPAPSSQYTSKNLGGAQYGAFKAGGGDAAIRQGRSAGEVVQQGRKNISKVVSGREMNVTAPGVVKSGFDMFDVVLGHLINEGYADTYEAALTIMTNMSEDWKYSIVEAYEDFPMHKVVKKAGELMGSSAGKNDPKSKKRTKRGIKMMDVASTHTPDR